MIKFKLSSILLVLLFAFVMFNCNSYPQTVTVKTTYTTPVGIDSCYLLVWKGIDTQQCPLIDGADYDAINKTGLTTYKVPLGTNAFYGQQMPSDGKTFRLALVTWDNNPQNNEATPSKLRVSTFYTLPFYVERATIINVEIF